MTLAEIITLARKIEIRFPEFSRRVAIVMASEWLKADAK